MAGMGGTISDREDRDGAKTTRREELLLRVVSLDDLLLVRNSLDALPGFGF